MVVASRPTLAAVERALRESWSIESCDPVDVENWTPDAPARGQCGATALVVRELLGGELLEAEVLFPDGKRQGFHYWNRLAEGDVDFTLEQFSPDEVVQAPHVVVGPPEAPWIVEPQYLVLRGRVLAALKSADPTVAAD
jgi:hypothetical protein